MDGNFSPNIRRPTHQSKATSLRIPTPYRTPVAELILSTFCQINSLHGTILYYGGLVMTACMTAATDCGNDWGTDNVHCIGNAPRTRAAFDMRFFSCTARACGAVHEMISEVRSLFMRGAFDSQQSILQLNPNIPYCTVQGIASDKIPGVANSSYVTKSVRESYPTRYPVDL